MVALYVRFAMVEVLEPGFKKTFFRAWFWAIRLRLEEQIYAEFCDSLDVFLDILSGSRSRD